MSRVNCVTVCRDKYETKKDFENAIKKMIMSLLDNDYIATIKYDANDKELGVVVINFNYADEGFGDYYPHWLLPDEVEDLMNEKQ